MCNFYSVSCLIKCHTLGLSEANYSTKTSHRWSLNTNKYAEQTCPQVWNSRWAVTIELLYLELRGEKNDGFEVTDVGSVQPVFDNLLKRWDRKSASTPTPGEFLPGEVRGVMMLFPCLPEWGRWCQHVRLTVTEALTFAKIQGLLEGNIGNICQGGVLQQTHRVWLRLLLCGNRGVCFHVTSIRSFWFIMSCFHAITYSLGIIGWCVENVGMWGSDCLNTRGLRGFYAVWWMLFRNKVHTEPDALVVSIDTFDPRFLNEGECLVCLFSLPVSALLLPQHRFCN